MLDDALFTQGRHSLSLFFVNIADEGWAACMFPPEHNIDDQGCRELPRKKPAQVNSV